MLETCPVSPIPFLRLPHSPSQDKSHHPWLDKLSSWTPPSKKHYLFWSDVQREWERAAAKKLSANRKTWALPRHRFLLHFLPREKGESLKGCRRAECQKKRNSLFPLQNQNKGIHSYQCSFEHSFNTYTPVRLGCFWAQTGAASLGTTKHKWDLFPVRVDLQIEIFSESHLLLVGHSRKHRLGRVTGLEKGSSTTNLDLKQLPGSGFSAVDTQQQVGEKAVLSKETWGEA